ncbi:GNAT family N-acetyltransferase [Terrihabitans sp. B22-R8]|uniref:GNAT family N-acetyltransferase n=1 Tax=Terrihabitans sp. B22-R8 TaxID=3425128 RepID=UPI00403D337C
MSLIIRSARPGEAGLVLQLVRELADYEKLLHEVVATESMMDEALFGPSPRAFCDIAEWDGAPVGLALWFYNFSTFEGRSGIYLEDLFVRPDMRGKGIGKSLLSRLAQRCRDENLARLEWSVLDWNAPSIDFYRSQGAELMDGWTTCRVSGEALARLGEQAA